MDTKATETNKFLPENSKYGEADNPRAFEEFLAQRGRLGAQIFDNAILCRDRDTRGYTWHIMCNDYRLSEIRSKIGRKLEIEPRIFKLRRRNLECAEVVTQASEHYFLD